MPTAVDGGTHGAPPAPADAASAARLVMRGIRKRYGATVALDDVDFDARAGEIHALLGENGAGKSTLMQILSGLTHADGGETLFEGAHTAIPTPREARRLGIAIVHQHFTLVPAFTVAENLALDAPATGWQGAKPYRAKVAAARTLDYARSLGWELPADTRVASLSVGIQQRVEIVKALATDARLLIFDEPTAVLSRNEIDELFDVLRRQRDAGKTVLLIAHKLAEILAVADRVTVLRRGRRVASVPVVETNAEQLAAWMIGAVQAPSPEAVPSAASTEARAPLSPALICSGMRVRGDRGEQIVRDVAFTVARGEIFGIGGVDGNGQSELAEALTGLRPFEAETLTWEDRPFQPGTDPHIGYIPQDRRRIGLAVTMSVADNLLFDAVREREFHTGPFLRRRALSTLALNMIRDFDIRTPGPNLPVSALSGGNQQKIVVARSLRGQPDLIVAMNPTRGLDIGATRFVHSQLRQARECGAAVVLISTDLDELAAVADRAAILADGTLTEIELRAADETQVGLLLGGAGNRPIAGADSNG
ncbi:MAG: nucleoside transporter ATP-binding protein [Chthonomonadaceae bacterium]|nr:nucleoside transporter ATP-binding protein [Chthonomonadaceae bacterium]